MPEQSPNEFMLLLQSMQARPRVYVGDRGNIFLAVCSFLEGYNHASGMLDGLKAWLLAGLGRKDSPLHWTALAAEIAAPDHDDSYAHICAGANDEEVERCTSVLLSLVFDYVAGHAYPARESGSRAGAI